MPTHQPLTPRHSRIVIKKQNTNKKKTFAFIKYWFLVIVKGDLEIDNPDTVIINGGTNNLTKTNQSAEEITEEILDIVDICRKHGVKNILVSSITCRPEFQWKIDDINKLLQDNSVRYSYVFINNGNINENHLKRDQLHLNHHGTILLTNNFLFHLNRPCVTYPFASIWD